MFSKTLALTLTLTLAIINNNNNNVNVANAQLEDDGALSLGGWLVFYNDAQCTKGLSKTNLADNGLCSSAEKVDGIESQFWATIIADNSPQDRFGKVSQVALGWGDTQNDCIESIGDALDENDDHTFQPMGTCFAVDISEKKYSVKVYTTPPCQIKAQPRYDVDALNAMNVTEFIAAMDEMVGAGPSGPGKRPVDPTPVRPGGGNGPPGPSPPKPSMARPQKVAYGGDIQLFSDPECTTPIGEAINVPGFCQSDTDFGDFGTFTAAVACIERGQPGTADDLAVFFGENKQFDKRFEDPTDACFASAALGKGISGTPGDCVNVKKFFQDADSKKKTNVYAKLDCSEGCPGPARPGSSGYFPRFRGSCTCEPATLGKAMPQAQCEQICSHTQQSRKFECQSRSLGTHTFKQCVPSTSSSGSSFDDCRKSCNNGWGPRGPKEFDDEELYFIQRNFTQAVELGIFDF